jgi:hypothetical protein
MNTLTHRIRAQSMNMLTHRIRAIKVVAKCQSELVEVVLARCIPSHPLDCILITSLHYKSGKELHNQLLIVVTLESHQLS